MHSWHSGLCVGLALSGSAVCHVSAEVPYQQPMVWIFGDNYPQSGLCLGTKADGSLLVPIIKLEVETPNNSFQQLAGALADSIEAHGDRPIAIWMHHFGNYLDYKQWGNLDNDHDLVPGEPEDSDGVEHLIANDFYNYHPVALLCHPLDSMDASFSIPAPPSGSCSPIAYDGCDADPMTLCVDDLSYTHDVYGNGSELRLVKVRRAHTMWNENGINDGYTWMMGLLTAYTDYRDKNNQPLPTPDRFHFDCEHDVSMWGYAFELSKLDQRWSTQDITGFDQTLDELFTDFKSELGYYYPAGTFRPGDGYDWGCAGEATRNHAAYNWLFGIGQQVGSGALEAAAFQPIHSVFGSGVKCSEYLKSARFDSTHPYLHPDAAGATFLNKAYWNGKGDLQGLFLYNVAPQHQQGLENEWDATIRVCRKNLDSAIRSYGGDKQHEMSPYIQAPGHTVRTGSGEPVLQVSKADARRMLALLRSRDVPEFIVFNPPDNRSPYFYDTNNPLAALQRWTDLADAIDQVWGTALEEVLVITGSVQELTIGSPEELAALRFAHDDPLTVRASAQNNGNRTAALHVTFDTNFMGAHNGVMLQIESAATNAGVVGAVDFWNRTTSTWNQVASGWNLVTSGDNDTIDACAAGFHDYVSSGGQVFARLRFSHVSSAFDVKIDLVQLVGTGSARPYDVNDDGQVTTADVLMVLSHLNEPVSNCPSCDVNCSTTIDLDDYNDVLGNEDANPPVLSGCD